MLCRTSKMPGKTKCLQFYSFADNLTYLVDSVGYGYAEGSSIKKKKIMGYNNGRIFEINTIT